MRTTVNVDEQVLLTAKERAHEHGVTLGEYVERALRHEANRGEPSERPEIPVFHGALRPGVDAMSNRELQELLDAGLPLDKLR